MKKWYKTSILTTVCLLLALIALIFIFNIFITIPSADIEFSPGQPVSKLDVQHIDEIPKNIIVFIADGMGFSHLSLAMHTQQSNNKRSVWQDFEVKGWHDARSAYGPLTDSEASATALATGTSTHFGHIGIDKDQNHLENLFEVAFSRKLKTGVVTDSYIWDGTPASFLTHTRNEDDAADIIKQIAASELDLLFGELEDVGEGDVPTTEEAIEIISSRFQLLDRSLSLNNVDSSIPVAAIFDEDEIQDMDSSPNLVKMTETALKYLTEDDTPFLLLVESEEMDAASHVNDSQRVVRGLQAIQETLSLLLDFSSSHEETMLIFTSDHETGGLASVADFDNYPNMQIRWSSKSHTSAVVPILAKGPGAEYFRDVERNWEIGYLLKKLISQHAQNEAQ